MGRRKTTKAGKAAATAPKLISSRPRKRVTASTRKTPVPLLALPEYAKVLIVPDTHVPYEDKQAWQLMLRAARTLNNGEGPDAIVLLGDFFDCYELSTHEKDLTRRADLADELRQVGERLFELDVICRPAGRAVDWLSSDTKISAGYFNNDKNFRQLYYIMGNHEARINRSLAREQLRGALNTYMSAGILQRRTLLQAIGSCGPYDPSQTWTPVEYGHWLRLGVLPGEVGGLTLTHDVGRAGQGSHLDAQRVFGPTNVVIGHTHRLASAYGQIGGSTYGAHQLGWLGDARQQSYLAAARMAREWAQGFGVATIEAPGMSLAMAYDGGWRRVRPSVSVEAVAIQRDGSGSLSACVEGRIVD